MRYIFTLISCLLTWLTFGQNSSLLWEISGKGLKQPSFLYGTMHVQDSRVFQFGDSVMIKFYQCKAYAGELDMDEIKITDAMELMMMPKDTTLDMLLSSEDYLFVKKKTSEKLGAMSMIVDKIKPIFTSAIISEMEAKANKGQSKDSSDYLDKYLQKHAKVNGMKVSGIETAKEQMAALDKLSLREQAQMLLQSLKEEEQSNEFMEDMYKNYLSQDLKGIEELIQRANMPDIFSESILKKRNYLMADRIVKLIKKDPTFIGVGVAHLPGGEGVIALLQKKGYKVRPVISKYTGKD